MDWASIIVAVVSALSTGSAVSALLYLRENKRAKQLDNEKSAIEEWQGIAKERKHRCDELKASLDAKDQKIDSLYRENAELRKRNDRLSSANTALSIFKCRIIGCDRRHPPFGKVDCNEQVNTENSK